MPGSTTDDRKSRAWPPVSRICYLAGGLTAINNQGPRVVITSGNRSPELRAFELGSFPSLYDRLRQLGFTVVGAEFYQDFEEIHDLRPAGFRVFYSKNAWLTEDTHQLWRQIAATAMKADRMDIADCSARIGFEIEAVQYRFKELCRAYAIQLRSLVIRNELEEYKRFDDLNSSRVLHGIHALFYELAVLRDYTAEFIARFPFNAALTHSGTIRTMSELRNGLMRLGSPTDELAKELIEITDRDGHGWLATLSAYRNLFTHIAPIEAAAHKYFAVQQMISTEVGALPSLYHPLPRDVLLLTNSRKRGFPFERFEDWAKASVGHRPDPQHEPDALNYLHHAVLKISELAMRVLSRSPIAPRMTEFVPSDIVGSVRVTRGGKP